MGYSNVALSKSNNFPRKVVTINSFYFVFLTFHLSLTFPWNPVTTDGKWLNDVPNVKLYIQNKFWIVVSFIIEIKAQHIYNIRVYFCFDNMEHMYTYTQTYSP